MLTVVQNEQQAALTQRLNQRHTHRLHRRLAHADRGSNRIGDDRRRRQRRQVHQPDPIGVGGKQRLAGRQRQPGLPHAARPAQRDQPRAVLDRAADGFDLALAGHQTAQRTGEIGGRHRLLRRLLRDRYGHVVQASGGEERA